ncbi:hypothetical protein BGW80DRAFT_1261706 [Lactifluus volemus]|nr:hypothetical protein BGW80DRAFT_1261706 [Lactifluus volemus]
MGAKSKARTLIVRLISTAQTGFFYTTQRPRLGPKLAAVKYDPRGAFLLFFFFFFLFFRFGDWGVGFLVMTTKDNIYDTEQNMCVLFYLFSLYSLFKNAN